MTKNTQSASIPRNLLNFLMRKDDNDTVLIYDLDVYKLDFAWHQ